MMYSLSQAESPENFPPECKMRPSQTIVSSLNFPYEPLHPGKSAGIHPGLRAIYPGFSRGGPLHASLGQRPR